MNDAIICQAGGDDNISVTDYDVVAVNHNSSIANYCGPGKEVFTHFAVEL